MRNPSRKLLLMGRAGAGKTSMRSIIFANYLSKDTQRLTATNNIEHSHLRFFGNLMLSLWDCGGQDIFMENYFDSQREYIFRNSQVLIYVLEVRFFSLSSLLQHESRSKVFQKDLQYFKSTAASIRQFSPRAKAFCLIHKLDLVRTSDREAVVERLAEHINGVSGSLQVQVFGTSIWDETLFKAWSEIAYALVPNVSELERDLKHFCDIAGADEVVLFEKSTFLVISCATRSPHPDPHRFEKISNICKQFKLTCAKTQANFSSWLIHGHNFTAFIERFTRNTFVLVITTDQEIHVAASLCNIDFARDHFDRISESQRLGASL